MNSLWCEANPVLVQFYNETHAQQAFVDRIYPDIRLYPPTEVLLSLRITLVMVAFCVQVLGFNYMECRIAVAR